MNKEEKTLIQILVEEGALKNALIQVFGLFQRSFELLNGVVVCVEEGPDWSHFRGFDKALQHVDVGAPIVMLALCPARILAKDPRFHLAMSYGHVHLVDALQTVSQSLMILSDPEQHRRPNNLLVRDAFSLPAMRQNEMSTIRHDLGHAQRAEPDSESRQRMDERWMPLARGIFGDLTRQELVAAVEAAENVADDDAPLAGRSYDCCCCDAEGTLIDEDNQINHEILDYLNERATTKPVVIWTGGNAQAIGEFLRKKGASYPVIPKQLLRGAKVTEALDDEEYEEFYSKYGIVVHNFVRLYR